MGPKEMAVAISNLTARVNNLEAMVMHMRRTPSDPLVEKIDSALAALKSATDSLQASRAALKGEEPQVAAHVELLDE